MFFTENNPVAPSLPLSISDVSSSLPLPTSYFLLFTFYFLLLTSYCDLPLLPQVLHDGGSGLSS